MKYKIIKELRKKIKENDSGSIICIDCKSRTEYSQFEKSIKNSISKMNYYYVGKSKRNLFHTYTVYEELKSILGKDVDSYIKKKELSPSRMSRPLESLSGERWRASLYIAELLNKKIILFPWIEPEIINMYSKIWLIQDLKKMENNKVKILLPTCFEKCTDSSLFSESIIPTKFV